MNSDIRLFIGFHDHPKTVKLERRLGVAGPWCLTRLWSWVAANRPNGDLAGMDAEDVAIAARWPGEAQYFTSALQDIRWLDGEEKAWAVHGWAEHNPQETELRRLLATTPDPVNFRGRA